MRNGQQKRMRGRNRRGQNPMTRVFESNGPDVKVRGTAAHVAEKYVQLARDSQSSGDHVSAENYLQHAEHYFRLIAAAQAQFQQQPGFGRPDQEGRSEEFDDDDEPNMPHLIHPGLARLHEPQERPYQGQPHGQHQPREHGGQPRYNDQQPRYPDQQPRMAEGQPQPVVEGDDPGFGGLPSFITGGGPQPSTANGHDGGNGGEGRGGFRRRRRHRFPARGDQPGGEGMAGEGPPDTGGDGNG